MQSNVYISQAGLKRLPQYLRILKDKKGNNIKFISSTALANELNLKPIQVRKDLALVSKSDGKPKVGFNIEHLIIDLEDFLGLNNITNAIIVGAGRLGQALLNYKGFENNINIVAAFDNDKIKCNNKIIFHINEMKNFINKMNVEIGIITVPKQEAQKVCNQMIECGIGIIWNFAPINLKAQNDIIIKNEDLSASLLVLLNNKNKN